MIKQFGWVLLGLGCAVTPALAEELTLTTYYPSPRGVYRELRVTNNAYLGGEVGGAVVLGSRTLPQALVAGLSLVVAGPRRDPAGGSCPSPSEWFDEDGDGLKDPQECRDLSLLVAHPASGLSRLASDVTRLELGGADTDGMFWIMSGPDEGGTGSANAQGDNVLGWTRTPGFAGRQLTLMGNTVIGDDTQPLTSYSLEAAGTILPGRFGGDGEVAGPRSEGELYYNTLEHRLKFYDNTGTWRPISSGPMRTIVYHYTEATQPPFESAKRIIDGREWYVAPLGDHTYCALIVSDEDDDQICGTFPEDFIWNSGGKNPPWNISREFTAPMSWLFGVRAKGDGTARRTNCSTVCVDY